MTHTLDRLLRDQPDASQLEAAEGRRAADPPPISLIGVHLSEDSVRLAERALEEDPAVRHRPRNRHKTSIAGARQHNIVFAE